MVASLDIEVVCSQVLGGTPQTSRMRARSQFRLQLAGNRPRHLFLNREDVLHFAVDRSRPYVAAALAIDEVCCDARLVIRNAYAAGNNHSDVEAIRDFAHVVITQSVGVPAP